MSTEIKKVEVVVLNETHCSLRCPYLRKDERMMIYCTLFRAWLSYDDSNVYRISKCMKESK